MVPPLSDVELVVDAQGGSAAAQELLIARWLPVVLGWCQHLSSPGINAEDATHDVFVIVIRRLPSLKKPQAFPAWLFQVTRRVLRGYRRRAWFRRWVPGESWELATDPGPGPQEQTEHARRLARVQQALQVLPQAQREVLILCDMEERTAAEVSGLLSLPVGTVKSRLRLARKRFHAALEVVSA